MSLQASEPTHREIRNAALLKMDKGARGRAITYTSQAGVVIHATGHYDQAGRFVPDGVITADGHAVASAPSGWHRRFTPARPAWMRSYPVPRPRKPRKGAA